MVSKKSIYRKYHIEYTSGKITLPDGTQVSPLLKCGNAKLDKSIYTWSMRPLETCPNCSECSKTCYAKKNKRFPSCWEAWGRNTQLAKHNLDFLERAISAQIEADKPKFVRVHVSGDFFSVDYIDMWSRISERFPCVRFWTYTKVGVMPKFSDAISRLESHNNFNIVESLPLGVLNYGSEQYLDNLYSKLISVGCDPFICPCGKDDSVRCGVECTACANCKYVLFHQH